MKELKEANVERQNLRLGHLDWLPQLNDLSIEESGPSIETNFLENDHGNNLAHGGERGTSKQLVNESLNNQLLLVTEGLELVLHDPCQFSTNGSTTLVRYGLSSLNPNLSVFWLLNVAPPPVPSSKCRSFRRYQWFSLVRQVEQRGFIG